MATTNADTKPMIAAMCALIWKKASAASITTTGIAAAMVDSQTLLNGSYTCDHMGDLLRLYQRFKCESTIILNLRNIVHARSRAIQAIRLRLGENFFETF
jgi:hypothetical protein